jgi:ribonuclease HII
MPHFLIEAEYAPHPVCGVDEAGCGPWAGPVVAAAVIFRSSQEIPAGLNDSKKLSRQIREKLFLSIQHHALCTGIGIAEIHEIDTLNIWGATQLAMKRAVEALQTNPTMALIDGKRTPKNFPCATRTFIGGDAISSSIAAASILAKVTRDQLMDEYAKRFPAYGFERHAGYGTKFHQEAIARHGICPIHRLSFRPIRDYLAREAS